MLQGGNIAGGGKKSNRVPFEFYATNPKAVEMLMQKLPLKGLRILDCCVGGGNIAKALKNFSSDNDVVGIDIVNYGYPGTIVTDFLEWKNPTQYDAVVMNPPFSKAREFVEKSISCVKDGGYVAAFLKIQFLEGKKREDFFTLYPPKYIYVFRSRMATWNNGEEFDNEGKPWATTMCHAWFVWEKGFHGEPVVRWL